MESVSATYVRGGTSRALVFRGADLPKDPCEWPKIFAKALGSPDPLGYQLDGLGGGITSLSKVAVVDPVSRCSSDIDYLFFQVDPRTGNCSTRANCGNISSAVGLVALANGWIKPFNNDVKARIYNVNSRKTIEATFKETTDASEMISIDGVGGLGAPIRLTFVEPGGSVASSMFPTNLRTEWIRLSNKRSVEATLIDAAVPTVIALASDFEISGGEPQAELAANHSLLADMKALRIQAGIAMGLSANAKDFDTELWNLPDVVLISAAKGASHIRARFFSADSAHRAAPVTSSIALGCAMSLTDCITDQFLAQRTAAGEDRWEIEHPSGQMNIWAQASRDRRQIVSASVLRTARLLMEGKVFLG